MSRVKHGSNPILTKDGARKALNYITDVAKGRKSVVTFIYDEETGHIEAVSNKHTNRIEVQYRTTRT